MATVTASWFPTHFQALNGALLANRQGAKTLQYDIRNGQKGKHYVYGLGKAASKYKLADVIEDVVFSAYTDSTQRQYTAQVKLTAAFIAFEAYSRLRGNQKWHDFASRIAKLYTSDARRLRCEISASALRDLAAFMSSNRLKGRIGQFSNGDDLECFAVACALRNGFSHGLYGSRRDFTGACQILRPLLLRAIREDCSTTSRSVSANGRLSAPTVSPA